MLNIMIFLGFNAPYDYYCNSDCDASANRVLCSPNVSITKVADKTEMIANQNHDQYDYIK